MKLEKEIGKKSCAVIKLTYMYQVTTLISYRQGYLMYHLERKSIVKIKLHLIYLSYLKKEYTYHYINS